MQMEWVHSLAEKSPAVFWDEQYGVSKAARAGTMSRHSPNRIARRAKALRPERSMVFCCVGEESVGCI
jgi:hypothetical protein